MLNINLEKGYMTFCLFSRRPKSLVILIFDYKTLVIFSFIPEILWRNVVGYTFARKITNPEVRY